MPLELMPSPKKCSKPKSMQVGKYQIWDKKTQKKIPLKYSHIPKDADGFVTDMSYLPISRDLLYLRRLGKDRIITGWWDGKKWFGLRLKNDDTVIAWKRNFEDDRAIY